MSEAVDVSQFSAEEIAGAVERGELVKRDGYDDDGNEISQYELTELGRARTMNQYFMNVIRQAIGAYRQGRSYNKVITFLEEVLKSVTPLPEPEVIEMTSVEPVTEDA